MKSRYCSDTVTINSDKEYDEPPKSPATNRIRSRGCAKVQRQTGHENRKLTRLDGFFALPTDQAQNSFPQLTRIER